MATVTPAGTGIDQRTLTAMVRAMFPHASFPDGPYERTAAAIVEAAQADVANLFVSDGSVFTTGAAANPTLTIVALAIRQAEHIGDRVRAGAL